MEAGIIVGIIDNKKAEIPSLPEFITVKATHVDSQDVFASIIEVSKGLNVDSDKELVAASSFAGGAQRVLFASLRHCLMSLCYYSVMVCHAGKDGM